MSSSVSLSCLLEIFLITSGKKRKISTADQEILWQALREDMLRAVPIEAGRRRRRISSAAPNNSCPRRTTPRRRRRRGPRPSRRIERAIECSSPFPFPSSGSSASVSVTVHASGQADDEAPPRWWPVSRWPLDHQSGGVKRCPFPRTWPSDEE